LQKVTEGKIEEEHEVEEDGKLGQSLSGRTPVKPNQGSSRLIKVNQG